MARRRLPDPVIHVRAVGEPSSLEECRFSQANGGIRMHNGALISVFLATRLRANIARQSASLLRCTGTLHNGSACAKRGWRIEDC